MPSERFYTLGNALPALNVGVIMQERAYVGILPGETTAAITTAGEPLPFVAGATKRAPGNCSGFQRCSRP
jgi:hypothetical protein